jgi:predicted dehydrogenase
MEQRFKAAVIGCGNISVNHFRALRNVPAAELAAVCDSDPERLRKAETEQQVCGYTEYKTLLADPQIDVVHICTPHNLHAEMTLAALRAGKNVLCEKPMALSVSDAEQMQAAAAASGKQLGICFQNRYNAASQKIRAELDSGRYGKLLGGRAMVTWNRFGDYYEKSPWRGTWQREGGSVLMNQAIHTLDLLQWFGGEVTKVSASMSTKRLAGVIETEDTCDALLVTKTGARLLLYCSNCYVANTPIQLELLLENGEMRLSGNQLTLRCGSKTTTEDYTSGVVAGKDYWGSGHGFLIEDFYRCLATHTPFPIGPAEALVTTKIVEEMYRPYRGRRLDNENCTK